MSYNGTGTFNINTAGQPVVTGTTITSTAFNLLTADLASGLTTALTKDGQTTPTANIPMGGFKITGLGAGTGATDAAQYGQLQAGATTIATIAGTDTLTGSLNPALTAYAVGNLFTFVAANTNTGATTINLNSLGAKSITKNGSAALSAGDIVSGQVYLIEYDGTRFQLINPSALGVSTISFGSTGLTPSTATGGAVTVAGTLAIANGGTNSTATPTAGGVVYGNGTAQAVTSAGTAGYFLQSNGASAPTWGASTVALLATIDATSGTYVTFDGYFSSAYDVYMITGSNFFVEDTYQQGYIRAQTAASSTFQTGSNYRYSLITSGSDSTSVTAYAGTTNAFMPLNLRSAFYRSTGLVLYIYNPLNTDGSKVVSYTTLGRDTGDKVTQTVGTASYTAGSAAISGIRFFWSAGDFQSGKFQLYGLKNS